MRPDAYKPCEVQVDGQPNAVAEQSYHKAKLTEVSGPYLLLAKLELVANATEGQPMEKPTPPTRELRSLVICSKFPNLSRRPITAASSIS